MCLVPGKARSPIWRSCQVGLLDPPVTSNQLVLYPISLNTSARPQLPAMHASLTDTCMGAQVAVKGVAEPLQQPAQQAALPMSSAYCHAPQLS